MHRPWFRDSRWCSAKLSASQRAQPSPNTVGFSRILLRFKILNIISDSLIMAALKFLSSHLNSTFVLSSKYNVDLDILQNPSFYLLNLNLKQMLGSFMVLACHYLVMRNVEYQVCTIVHIYVFFNRWTRKKENIYSIINIHQDHLIDNVPST